MNKILLNFFVFLMASNAGAQQVCQTEQIPSAPDSRYVDNPDGTVTDLHHGLVWKRCSEGQDAVDCSLGTAATFTWQEALQHVDGLNASGGYAGFTDWRLPNIKELASLVETQCLVPAINDALFPATQHGEYWSSTIGLADTVSWAVRFGSGTDLWIIRDVSIFVRLVRGGA